MSASKFGAGNSWGWKGFIETGGNKLDARISANVAAHLFEVKISSSKQVLSITDADNPQFSDYAFTFSSMSVSGVRTEYEVTFRKQLQNRRRGGQQQKVQRQLGRVAEYYYKQVQLCRKWMPHMRRDFAQFPRLKDVYAQLKNLVHMEEFWHPRVQRRRKEIYCWDQVVPVETAQRGLPSKMLRASYDYFKTPKDDNDDQLDAEAKTVTAREAEFFDAEDNDDRRQQQGPDPRDLGQFGRVPKFKISITHERMDQILQLYPSERQLLQGMTARRLEENRNRPRADQQTSDEVKAAAQLEFWARYFIRVHDERRKHPDERFRKLPADAEACYFERPACLVKALHAAAVEQDVEESNDIENMDDQEEEQERRRRNEFKNEQRKIQMLKQHVAMLQEHSAMVVESTTKPPSAGAAATTTVAELPAASSSSSAPTASGAGGGASTGGGAGAGGGASTGGANFSAAAESGRTNGGQTPATTVHQQLGAMRPFLPYALRDIPEPPPKRLFPLVLKSHTTAPVTATSVRGAVAAAGTQRTSAAGGGGRGASIPRKLTGSNLFAVPPSAALGILDVRQVSLEVKAARRAKELGREGVVDLNDVTLLQPKQRAQPGAKRKLGGSGWTDAMKAAQLEYLVVAELQLQIDLVDHDLASLLRIRDELHTRQRKAVDMHSGSDREFFELYQRLKERDGLIATCMKFCNAKIQDKRAQAAATAQ